MQYFPCSGVLFVLMAIRVFVWRREQERVPATLVLLVCKSIDGCVTYWSPIYDLGPWFDSLFHHVSNPSDLAGIVIKFLNNSIFGEYNIILFSCMPQFVIVLLITNLFVFEYGPPFLSSMMVTWVNYVVWFCDIVTIIVLQTIKYCRLYCCKP